MINEAPTDALRLVPVEPTEAMIFAGVLAAMEAATEFMEDDFWKERHLAAIERMKSGDYGSDDERAKGVKVGSTLYRAMLSAAPASPLPGGGWQDISTAPKDGTRVLIGRWIDYAPAWRKWAVSVAYYESGRVGPMDSFHRQGWTETFAERGATHWMPLPAAPTGE